MYYLKIYRNTNYKKNTNTNYRNTNYRSAEIQITGLQKYKLNLSSPIIEKSPIIQKSLII